MYFPAQISLYYILITLKEESNAEETFAKRKIREI